MNLDIFLDHKNRN